MMIEDEELRRLYQTTASGRIQALNAGLLETPSVPEAARLEALRREAHSLKGDSRVMGLEDIGALAHHVEIVIKDLQQQVIEWRSPLTDRLDDALQAIAQLVEAATTGVAVEVDAPRVGANLQAAMVTAAPDAAVSDTVVSDAVVSDAVVPDAAEAGLAVTGERGKAKGHDIHEPASLSSRFVVDSDVRSLYGAASERRLQTLVQTLEALSQNPDEPSTLATFRGEAQGLKGDAQEVGQGAIAAIAHTFETIANRLMSEKNELTFSLQSSLWRGLQLIEQLVSVAVTEPSSEPSSEQSSEPLSGGASTEPSAEDLTQLFTELEAQIAQSHRPPSGLGEPGDIATATDLIADNELRDIYKDTSEARLQRLARRSPSQPEDLRPLAAH
ncbi:MAG: Hpt domain-containing protein, partial [Cyanobacteria bacterium J06598_3]